jgi:hypothetical protein
MNLPGAHDWPHCLNSEDVRHLPIEIQLKILHTHLYLTFPEKQTSSTITPLAQSAQEIAELCESPGIDYFLDNPTLPLSHETECQGIKIKYHPSMEGGGIYRSPMFIEVLSLIAPNRIFNHCLEWCSGPGFIGFSLLDRGICNNLSLSDVYEPIEELVKSTIDQNNLTNVNFFLSNNFDNIPKDIKFDLIIGILADYTIAPTAIAYGNASDVSSTYIPSGTTYSFNAATGVNATTNTITLPYTGQTTYLGNSKQLTYIANGNAEIPGLDSGQAYYLGGVADSGSATSFILYYDPDLKLAIDITAVGSGTHQSLPETYSFST